MTDLLRSADVDPWELFRMNKRAVAWIIARDPNLNPNRPPHIGGFDS